jgi:hypothetical protein
MNKWLTRESYQTYLQITFLKKIKDKFLAFYIRHNETNIQM